MTLNQRLKASAQELIRLLEESDREHQEFIKERDARLGGEDQHASANNCIKIFQLVQKGMGLRTCDQVTSLSRLLGVVRHGQPLRLSVLQVRKSDPTHS